MRLRMRCEHFLNLASSSCSMAFVFLCQTWHPRYYLCEVDIHFTLQEIKTLQRALDATDDEGEQRALEEDVTGKILWLSWCGILAEVGQRLPEESQISDLCRYYLRWIRLSIASGRKGTRRRQKAVTAFARVCMRSGRLLRNHFMYKWKMTWLTYGGSCLMRGQAYRSVNYGMLPWWQST
ncbi:hypothetical protein EDC04DRAFT_440787 [Pisolithus marmoratus]|nr:hypothetical protein EDC04DRAFT_440787 [Pisolithus marmoratus]